MARRAVLMLSLGILLLACSRGGRARLRLSAIQTVVLRDGVLLPANRSSWQPSPDGTIFQCMSDLECAEGNYCHTPTNGLASSRCQTCRRRNRHCHRDSMCCPGNHCSNNICVSDVHGFLAPKVPDKARSSLTKKKKWTKKDRMDIKVVLGKGQAGDPCLRSFDCSVGLCCARHFWTRICKPVLREGQVCTRHRRKGNHGLELFQRCPCGAGLSCQTLRDPEVEPSSSSSSSASLLVDAAKSKFVKSSSLSQHSSPSISSLSAKSSSVLAKMRLHICQKR